MHALGLRGGRVYTRIQMARANYVQEQEHLKREAAQKKLEKDSSKLIEEMIYGAPKGGGSYNYFVRVTRVLMKTRPLFSGGPSADRFLARELQTAGRSAFGRTAFRCARCVLVNTLEASN